MKTKGFRKALALLLSLVMMSAAFTMLAYADAPELTTFTTNNGASVRIGDVAGIRFKTTISKTEFNAVKDSITEIGTIIAPKAYVEYCVTHGAKMLTANDPTAAIKFLRG